MSKQAILSHFRAIGIDIDGEFQFGAAVLFAG